MSSIDTALKLTNDANTPVYQRIKDAIRAKVDSKQWPAQMRIPSENQLVDALGASRMTINRSLRELTNEGVLRRVHGLGTFVATPPRRAHLVELVSIADEITQQGKQHSSIVLRHKRVKAPAEICQRMKLAHNSFVFMAELVHQQDGVPIQLETRYVNPDLVPDFLDVDLTQTTPAEHLIASLTPDELEHIVQAIMPEPMVASHLHIELNEPCLKLRRRTWKDKQVVTTVDLIYPSSRYELGARYAPNPN